MGFNQTMQMKEWVKQFNVPIQQLTVDQMVDAYQKEDYVVFDIDFGERDKVKTIDDFWKIFKSDTFLSQNKPLSELTVERFLKEYAKMLCVCEERTYFQGSYNGMLLMVNKDFLKDFGILNEKEWTRSSIGGREDFYDVYWNKYMIQLMHLETVENSEHVLVSNDQHNPCLLPKDIYSLFYHLGNRKILYRYHSQRLMNFIKEKNYLLPRFSEAIEIIRIEKNNVPLIKACEINTSTNDRYFLIGEDGDNYLFGFLEKNQTCSELDFIVEWAKIQNITYIENH